MKRRVFARGVFFSAAIISGHISSHAQLLSLTARQDQLTGNVASFTMYTVKGMPAKTVFENIKSGTVFFKDEWMPAKVRLLNGKVYENVRIKINLFQHTLHFLLNDTDFVAALPVLEVLLADSLKKDVIRFVHANNLKGKLSHVEDGWYQSLVEGKACFYKKIEKKIESSREYNSATTTYTIETSESFLLLHQGRFHHIRKWKDFENVFKNDPAISLKLVTERNKQLKLQEAVIAVLLIYNSGSPGF